MTIFADQQCNPTIQVLIYRPWVTFPLSQWIC